MNVVLWMLQVLLAAAFLAHGWMFLDPPASVVEQMNATLPRWFQVFLGVAELAAGGGLTLPGLSSDPARGWSRLGRVGRRHRDRVGDRAGTWAGRIQLRTHHIGAHRDGRVPHLDALARAADRATARRAVTDAGRSKRRNGARFHIVSPGGETPTAHRANQGRWRCPTGRYRWVWRRAARAPARILIQLTAPAIDAFSDGSHVGAGAPVSLTHDPGHDRL